MVAEDSDSPPEGWLSLNLSDEDKLNVSHTGIRTVRFEYRYAGWERNRTGELEHGRTMVEKNQYGGSGLPTGDLL